MQSNEQQELPPVEHELTYEQALARQQKRIDNCNKFFHQFGHPSLTAEEISGDNVTPLRDFLVGCYSTLQVLNSEPQS